MFSIYALLKSSEKVTKLSLAFLPQITHFIYLLVINRLFIFGNWKEYVGRSIFLIFLKRKEKD